MKINRQLRTALIVLVVLGAAAFCIVHFNPFSTQHQPQSITLSDRAAGALATVRVRNAAGSYTVTREDEAYRCAQLSDLPTSETAFDTLAEHCTGIVATSSAKLPDEPDALGFDRPKAVVEITFSDDSGLTLTLGNQTADGTAYYLRLTEGGTVYLLSAKDAAVFLADVTNYVDLNLATFDSLPATIELKNAKAGLLTAQSLAEPATDGEGNIYDYTLSDETRTTFADTESLQSFFGGLTNLKALSVVQLSPTLDELVSYGILDNAGQPVHTLTFGSGDTMIALSVGNRSGEYYYVYKSGVNVVFSLALDDMTWDNVSFYLLMSRWPLAPLMADVASITAQTENGAYEITIDGATANCNGMPLSDRTFAQLYQLLFSFQAEYEIDGQLQPILPDLTLTIRYRAPGADGAPRTDVVRFVPYGLRRDAIEINGTALYAVRSTYAARVSEILLNLYDGMEISSSW